MTECDHSKTDNRNVWLFCAGLLAVAVTLFTVTGFHVALNTCIVLGSALFVGGLVTALLAQTMPGWPPLLLINAHLQQMTIGLAIMLLEYAASQSGRPLFDSVALRSDQALGYDWKIYLGFLHSHPQLSAVLDVAYDSLGLQMSLVLVALWLWRGSASLHRVVIGNGVILLITTAAFALWPVTTAWVHLHSSAAELHGLGLRAGGGWPDQLLLLRNGAGFDVNSGSNFAIIGFPSYHTAAAILMLVSTWPLRVLRPAAVAWTGLIVAATPYNGGHYLVDLICAPPVVAVGVVVAGRCFPKSADTVGAWPWFHALLLAETPRLFGQLANMAGSITFRSSVRRE